jgi:2-polyprenyl-6-methoxyphenol hydroxylase-like FAD-dependent oxidoreductase
LDTVLIVGAGPSGLVLALALLQRGIPFRIIDEKEGPSENSKALAIHARTLELFEKLEVIEPFLAKGKRVHYLILHRGKKEYPFEIKEDFLQDTTYPFVLALPQSETEHILIEALVKLGGRVEWTTKFLSCENNRAELSTKEKVAFDWLIGCDGGKSTVRKFLKLPFEGAELAETFLIVDVKGKANVKDSSLHFFLSSHGLMGLIPFQQGLNRLIFALNENEKIDENIQAIQVQIERRGGGGCLIPEKIEWFSLFKIHRRMVRKLRVGNCFLVGDSAHIHSPAGGQGMNTGIQDAYNLAWKIAQVIQGISPSNLINSYEQERLPIAKHVLNGTTRLTQILTFVQKRGLISVFFALFLLFKKIAARRAVRNLTELAVAYSKNPYIEKTAYDAFWRGPKCGERAPNVLLQNGKFLFNILNKKTSSLLLFRDTEIFEGVLSRNLDYLGPSEASHANTFQNPSVGEESRAHPRLVFQNKGFEILILKDANLMKAYHANKDSVYFIRPDGVIGYRSRKLNKDKLKKYLSKVFILT